MRRRPPGGLPGDQVDLRKVEYLTAVPDDPRRWVLVTFTTAGDGDVDSEATGLVVELFDAIMSTWRWDLVMTARVQKLPAEQMTGTIACHEPAGTQEPGGAHSARLHAAVGCEERRRGDAPEPARRRARPPEVHLIFLGWAGIALLVLGGAAIGFELRGGLR